MLLGKYGCSVLSNEDSADMISESEIVKKLDLGHSLLYVLKHPVHKDIVVLNSGVGQSGVVSLNA